MKTGEAPQSFDINHLPLVRPEPGVDYLRGYHTIYSDHLVEHVPGNLVRLADQQDGQPVEVHAPAPAGTTVINPKTLLARYVTRHGDLRTYDPLVHTPRVVRQRQRLVEEGLRASATDETSITEQAPRKGLGLVALIGSLLRRRTRTQATETSETEAARLAALPGSDRFGDFDLSAPYAQTYQDDEGLGTSLGRRMSLEKLLARDRERSFLERHAQAPARGRAKVEAPVAKDLDEALLTEVSQALGINRFLNGRELWEIRHDLPLEQAIDAVLGRYAATYRNREFDARAIARYNRLVALCQENRLPIPPFRR